MKYVLDCDPGHDDMVMILYALQMLDVVAVTTVAGNQSVEKVTRNALNVLQLAGHGEVPVGSGATGPLVGRSTFAPELHGETGLDGFEFPAHSLKARGSAVGLLREVVEQAESITIIATGPLTNVACFLIAEPELSRRVAKISVMGGSTTLGNMTVNAEFNVYADPEAASVVFASGIPIDMYGLNATTQVPLRDELVAAVASQRTTTAAAVVGLLEYYLGATARLSGRREAHLHDLCAAVGLVRPEFFEMQAMFVDVELRGDLTRGMTVCDSRFEQIPLEAGESPRQLRPEGSGHGRNARVAIRASGDAINAHLLDVLGRYL